MPTASWSASTVPDGPPRGPASDIFGGPGRSRIAQQVGEFHRSYELPIRTSPTALVGQDQVDLRLALVEEEVAELRQACLAGDLVGIADALADIVYVVYGTAHVYGIDLDAVLDEVHASNMTKLGPDGRPVRRADGKVLKGPGYRPPDVNSVLGSEVGRYAGRMSDQCGPATAGAPSGTLADGLGDRHE